MTKTEQQFDAIMNQCREIFVKKSGDYGPAWRVLRPESVTDQIFIKIKRIREIQMTGVSKVGDGVEGEFVAIINYSIMGLVQLEKGCANEVDMTNAQALELYNKLAEESKQLMMAKNHDYGEAWRQMRINSITDLIYQKVCRTKQIEDNKGLTEISEGVDANYFDMLNYSVFALIKLSE